MRTGTSHAGNLVTQQFDVFRAEKRSAQFFCAYPFAGASKLKTLPFDSVVLLSSGFCGKNTFYHLRFVQFHQICYKIGPGILPTPCNDKNENWTCGTGSGT